ncbi:MAG: hypothetical protein JXR56_03695 [Candidatus Cloacimonetes bacterium]|nr:hypothetical protein [Candidatus Cloacimonadota bacterium]
MMKMESRREKIVEFLQMIENTVIEMRKYSRPVLVWQVTDGTVQYSIWEDDVLSRFGLENVDGWDYEEDALFCPDWISDEEEIWDDDEDDDF